MSWSFFLGSPAEILCVEHDRAFQKDGLDFKYIVISNRVHVFETPCTIKGRRVGSAHQKSHCPSRLTGDIWSWRVHPGMERASCRLLQDLGTGAQACWGQEPRHVGDGACPRGGPQPWQLHRQMIELNHMPFIKMAD